MTLRSERRRTPWLHFILLLTCVALGGIIASQQRTISNQASLIQLLSNDSSQLATLKVQQLSHSGH